MAAGQEVTLFGRIAVSAKLISQEQLLTALRLQDRSGASKRLGDILIELGYISQAQLTWLIHAQQTLQQREHQAGGEAKRRTQLERRESMADDGTITLTAGQATPVERPAPVAQPAPMQPGGNPRPAAAGPAQAAAVAQNGAPEAKLNRILSKGMQLHASDIHLHAGLPIQMRLSGRLLKANSPALEAAQSEAMIMEILTPDQRKTLTAHNDLDFAYAIPGVGRFRGNAYRQRRGVDAVFRPIPPEPPTLDQLGLPSSLARLTAFHQGLVLVTGPAGCGKSSTLAALVNLINEDRPDHIITVEDPIEFVHRSKTCVVNQRQVRKHTESFASALRAALREDPDVIAIGELRDLETISLAITAAETGHLVLGTLHTNDAARTINRILDAYPPEQQSQIRSMISESLRAIVSQRLVPTVDGSHRVPALEILLVNIAVSNLIREERVFQLRSVMQTGRNLGMRLFDDSLLELVRAGTISKEMARHHCEDPKLFL